ncbi:hypothetical protein G9A89_003478 [Geosiphon pyriformis]|nr:hypothetical protein G9A89_003478 [Geosiphon pyriformis]
MAQSQQYTVNLLDKGLIISETHYGLFTRNWWIQKQFKNEVFTIPYRLYMCVGFKLNKQQFIMTIVKQTSCQKPGFICTNSSESSNIENSPSTAINTLYQSIFGVKTEYSGLSILADQVKKNPYTNVRLENYSPAAVANLCNTEIVRPKPFFSEHTENLIDWKMQMPWMSSRSNLKVICSNNNNTQRVDDIGNQSMIELTIGEAKKRSREYPLPKGWALKQNQKMAKEMQVELMRFVELGKIVQKDVPKVNMIQN